MSPSFARIALCAAVAFSLGACKTIPPDRYGIRRLNIEGTDEMDAEAVRACLASSERERLGVDLGTTSDLTCGEPPFDGSRARIRLFPWPWAEWPTLDASIFERDLERIERWYRARGYYDARVLAAEFDPPSAAASDELQIGAAAPCEREDDDEGCSVDITIRVEEGQPVLLTSLEIGGMTNLPSRVRRSLESAPLLEEGERFDEALYDDTKERLVSRLRESGYACATVEGHANVDPESHTATVVFDVTPGPVGHFENIEVVVSGDAEGIPVDTVRGAAGIDRGDRYSTTRITAAQRAIYALGAFSSVEVVATPRQTPGPDGAATMCADAVDVVITVSPGRRLRYGIGFGLQTGEVTSIVGSTQQNQRQWDVHLQTFFEHRNFLGGLRRFRIEERPKIVFPNTFPRVTDNGGTPDNPDDDARPNIGNELRITFRQPAFIESRTTLDVGARWDYGLDPIDTASIRHDIEASFVVSRPFWDSRILVSLGAHSQSYLPARSISDLHGPPRNSQPDYHLFFFSQAVRLDLRNDARSTRRGAYFAIDLQEALPRAVSTFTYIRVIPEARFFIPLPLRSVLAMRFSIGVMHGMDYDFGSRGRGDDAGEHEGNEYKSCALGPTRYRLRGGGPTSHRGFSAATLADIDQGSPGSPDPAIPERCRNDLDPAPDPEFLDRDGGIRRWEASLELRTRITESFGLVGFVDMGDVNRLASFRFNNLNTALGFGLRYYTIVGPVRLDFSFFPPGLQQVGPGRNNVSRPYYIGNNVHGTFTLTIGEAF